MNLLLFEPGEEYQPLSRPDRRAAHLLDIIGVQPGQRLRAGVVGGPIGEVLITEVGGGVVRFQWVAGGGPAPDEGRRHGELTILLGHPRPPVLRRLFKDLTTIGVDRILVVAAELTEKSYLDSKVWNEGALKAALLEGASQGGTTTLPDVRPFPGLSHALEFLDAREAAPGSMVRLCLMRDADTSLYSLTAESKICLLVGPERGWTAREARLLDEVGYKGVSVGRRILRTETAAVAATAYLSSFGDGSFLGVEPTSRSEE